MSAAALMLETSSGIAMSQESPPSSARRRCGEAMRALRACTPDERAAVLIWFCPVCFSYVGPGEGLPVAVGFVGDCSMHGKRKQ